MALLGDLGVVERYGRAIEIGAAVLPVGVEEQRIDARVDVIVVRDVGARAAARIVLLETARNVAQSLEPSGPARRAGVHFLVKGEGEEIGDVAFLNDKVAIHVGFAELQLGVEQHSQLGHAGLESHGDLFALPVAGGKHRPACARDLQVAAGENLLKCDTQQAIHGYSSMNPSNHSRSWRFAEAAPRCSIRTELEQKRSLGAIG